MTNRGNMMRLLLLSVVLVCLVAGPALAQSEHGWTEKPGGGPPEEPGSDGIIWQGRGNGNGGPPTTDDSPWMDRPGGGNGGGNGNGDPDADLYPWAEDPPKHQGNPGGWDSYPWGEDPPKCQGNPGHWDAINWVWLLLRGAPY